MAFHSFMTDTVSLVKRSGERHGDIPASVQRGKIFINDASLVIEQGDLIERVASNGLRETYEVLNPGFHEKFSSIDAHYQIEVCGGLHRSQRLLHLRRAHPGLRPGFTPGGLSQR